MNDRQLARQSYRNKHRILRTLPSVEDYIIRKTDDRGQTLYVSGIWSIDGVRWTDWRRHAYSFDTNPKLLRFLCPELRTATIEFVGTGYTASEY